MQGAWIKAVNPLARTQYPVNRLNAQRLNARKDRGGALNAAWLEGSVCPTSQLAGEASYPFEQHVLQCLERTCRDILRIQVELGQSGTDNVEQPPLCQVANSDQQSAFDRASAIGMRQNSLRGLSRVGMRLGDQEEQGRAYI